MAAGSGCNWRQTKRLLPMRARRPLLPWHPAPMTGCLLTSPPCSCARMAPAESACQLGWRPRTSPRLFCMARSGLIPPYRTNFTPAVFPCHQTSSHRRRVPAKSNANSKWEGMAASPCTTILAPFRETSDTMQGRSAQPCITSLAWIWRERRASRGIRFIDGRMPQHTSRWLREREEGTMGRRRHAYHRARCGL
jgi:hypothetical protein